MPKKSNINEFIIKAKKIHENKYDYNLLDFYGKTIFDPQYS